MARSHLRFLSLAGVVTAAVVAALFLSADEPVTLRLDNRSVIYPMTLAAYRSWMQGAIPQWSSGLWAGYPILADPQTGAFYLPHLLPFWLTSEPHLRAYDLATALHAGVLVAGTAALLLELGARRSVGLFGALLAILGSQPVFWAAGFLPCFAALSWWPWTMLGAERLASPERSLPRSLVLASAALGAQALAGYPEFALYSGCLAALWLVTRRTGLALPARCGRVALLGLAAALLAAPQLLASAAQLPHSTRAAAPPWYARGLVSLVLDEPGSLFDPRAALSLGRRWPMFVGAATPLLAVWGLLAGAPRRLFLAGVVAGSGILALGDATPFHALLAATPPFSMFRGAAKFLAVTEFALVWLAALGLEQLLRSASGRRVAVAGVLATLAVGEHAAYVVLRAPASFGPPSANRPLEPLLAVLRAQVLPLVRAETPEGPPPRLLVATSDSYVGNLGMLYGVESLRGGNVGLPNHHHPDLELSRAHLDLFGVDVVFRPGRGCQRYGRGLNLDIVHGEDDACVLRNPSSPRRYELLPSVRLVTSEEAMSELVASDPAGGVPVMTSHDDLAASTSEQAAPGIVSKIRYRPGAVELDVSTPSPRYLLVRESWLPGWSAEVDGRETPIRRAATMFFAVPVPAGRHVVALTYHHPGLAVGFTAMGVWLVFAVFALRPRRRVRRT